MEEERTRHRSVLQEHQVQMQAQLCHMDELGQLRQELEAEKLARRIAEERLEGRNGESESPSRSPMMHEKGGLKGGVESPMVGDMEVDEEGEVLNWLDVMSPREESMAKRVKHLEEGLSARQEELDEAKIKLLSHRNVAHTREKELVEVRRELAVAVESAAMASAREIGAKKRLAAMEDLKDMYEG